MSINQAYMTNPQTIERTLTTSPFISEKKIRGHTKKVFDCTSVTYPEDGQDRIISCSWDMTLRIFNLTKQKCERIIKHSNPIYSVHFYEEEKVLMTTDWRGELNIWTLFPRIQIIRKIEVSHQNSLLWKITQISSNEFICCVEMGVSKGGLFRIRHENLNNWSSEEIDYPGLRTRNIMRFNRNMNNLFGNNFPQPMNTNVKEELRCIYQSISQKNIILFSGGNTPTNAGRDYTIKSIDLNNNNNFNRFPRKRNHPIHCLTSFINHQDKEIILSGSRDEKIVFWSLDGEYIKEIKFEGAVDCFLNDFSRNNIFVVSGYTKNVNLYSFSTETEKLDQKVEKIHSDYVFCMNWINEEKNQNQNRFISCSADKSFNIYELKVSIYDINFSDINKSFICLEEMSDFQIKYKNKNIKFWKTFIPNKNKIKEKEETLRMPKFESYETNINEKTLLSIILGRKIEVSTPTQLSDYFFFFKVVGLKHCIASINRKIEELEDIEELYFLFKSFCLKYENEVIKSWFSLDLQEVQEVEKIHPMTFENSFALSLFNKMKNMNISKGIGFKMIAKDKSFGTIWYNLEEYEIIELINHNDFEGVGSEMELKVECFFKELYDNRESKFNLTLISADKEEFKVHKEILILRYEFFFLLFNFRGLEVTEYEKTGKITLVDLMSSNVVECLISYAYLGEVDVKNKDISAINTFCKLLIFCDQFNEKKLMRKVKIEFKNFVSYYESKKPEDNENEIIKINEINSILRNLAGLSNYLVGNDKILGIIIPMITKLGVQVSGMDKFIEELVIQSLTVKVSLLDKEREIEEKEMKYFEEKKQFQEAHEKDIKEKKKLQERILELKKLVGEINEKDDEGVGKGQIRDRENNEEEDEEIKKEQPKRKKRKINKK